MILFFAKTMADICLSIGMVLPSVAESWSFIFGTTPEAIVSHQISRCACGIGAVYKFPIIAVPSGAWGYKLA